MVAKAARKNGGPGVVQQSYELDVKNLAALQNSLDFQKVAELAKRMHSAARILVFGADLATSLVTFLDYQLVAIGLPGAGATGYGRIFHLARSATKDDVVIAISFRRGLRMTVNGLQIARDNGAYCVGIADTLLSPLVRIADVSFIASVETFSAGVSYVAPMAILNALLAACANVRRSRTLRLVREIDEEQRHGWRWYEDDAAH
jgi:DNA-binding MurR/RpiR family transcriptional regulator